MVFVHHSPDSPKLDNRAAPPVSLLTAGTLQVPRELGWVDPGMALTPEDVSYLPAGVPCNGHLRVRKKTEVSE